MVSGRASRPACTVTLSRRHDPSLALTDASHSIAIAGMFNAHHT